MDVVEFTPKSNSKRTVIVRNDCDGSPNCAAEIHLINDKGAQWVEAHLTADEAKLVIKALKLARREWKKQRKEAKRAKMLASQAYSVDIVDAVTDEPVAMLVYGRNEDPMSYTITLPATNDSRKCRQYRVVFRLGD